MSIQLLDHQKVCYICIKITIERDENDMMSQMAHAKNLGEPFMAHLENLYNIPWWLLKLSRISGGMKRGMTIEYLKCSKDLNFNVDFRVNGVLGMIVTKCDVILSDNDSFSSII